MTMTDLVSTQTYRSTKGRVPVYRPLLNGEEFDISVREAQIALTDNAHDTAVLAVTSATLTDTDGLIGACISFFYGQAPRTELFCGYIMTVSVDQAGQGNLQFSMMVFGATQAMQKGIPRFWTGRTIPSVVEELSYIGGLGFHGHPQPHIWPALAQTDDTYWRTAINFTKRLGWCLFNRYGILLCYDPNVLFAESGAYATLMSAQNRDFDPSAVRRMIEFTPSEDSDELPEHLGRKISYFTDNGVVQTTAERGTFKKYKFVTDFVIRNYEEAELLADAGAKRIEYWNQKAQARIWGDSDLYPGMCVDIVTSNTAVYKAKYDGRWLIKGVAHKMDTQQFQTLLHVARPSNKAAITQDEYRPFWQVAGRARPTLSQVDNGWISSWTDPRVRSVM